MTPTEDMIVTTKRRLTITEHKQYVLDLLAKLGLDGHYLKVKAAQTEQLLSESHHAFDRSIDD